VQKMNFQQYATAVSIKQPVFQIIFQQFHKIRRLKTTNIVTD